MSPSRRTRTTAPLLAAAVALTPALLLATPAAAVSESASCADVLAATPGAGDGEYQITVFTKTLDVYCADMASGTPSEYLTLVETGPMVNFSQDHYMATVQTNFTRVRLNLPTSDAAAFSIDPTDRRFSDNAILNWGNTGSCGWVGTDANLNLRGTPFGMSTANIVSNGWMGHATSITLSADTQVIDIVDGRGDCGGVDATNPFPLTWLWSVPAVTADPADQAVTSGEDATFTVAGSGTPTPTVSWEWSDDATPWTVVAGATSTTLVVPGVTTAQDGRQYRAVLTSDQGTAPSAAATLTVAATAPTVTDPADATAPSGGDATFTVAVTGDPAPAVQWEISRSGEPWAPIDGATGTTLVLEGVTTADAGLLVRAVVTSTAGADTSAAAALLVDASAPTVTDPSDVSVTAGDDATFTVAVTGDPEPAVQWQVSVDGVEFVDVEGATGTSLELVELTTDADGASFRAVVTNAGGTATSAAALLTVAPLAPVITVAPGAVTVSEGGDATFSVTATGDPAPTLQWQTSVDGTAWTSVAGATGATFTLTDVAAASNGLQVRVVATNEAGTVTSAAVTLTVMAAPAPATPGRTPSLAVTGSEPAAMLALSAMLLATGAAGVVAARRRPVPVRVRG